MSVPVSELAEKRRLIGLIIQGVTLHAVTRKTRPPDGDLLLALACRTLAELRHIAAEAGVAVDPQSAQASVPALWGDALESPLDDAKACAQQFAAWCQTEQIMPATGPNWRAWRHAWMLSKQQQ